MLAGRLEEAEGAHDVVVERLGRLVDAVLDGDGRGEVGHGVGAGEPAPAGVAVADVAHDELLEAGMAGERREVVGVALAQVVDREDRVPAIEELAHDPPADEAGGAGDDDPHGSRPSTASRRTAATSSAPIGSTRSDR